MDFIAATMVLGMASFYGNLGLQARRLRLRGIGTSKDVEMGFLVITLFLVWVIVGLVTRGMGWIE